MDHHKVWEVLCIPVHKPLIAILVNKQVLVNVQVILATEQLCDDGAVTVVTAVVNDVVAVYCLILDMAGQTCDLVLG